MPRTPFEKATLVRGVAARKNLAARLFRSPRVKFFAAPSDRLMASGEWKA
jgi:hypothetical protein